MSVEAIASGDPNVFVGPDGSDSRVVSIDPGRDDAGFVDNEPGEIPGTSPDSGPGTSVDFGPTTGELPTVAAGIGDLISRGEALVAYAEEFQTEVQAYLLGETYQLVPGDMSGVAQGMTAPPGFLEWRALGTFVVDNVRLLRAFAADLYDGILTAGNIAITTGMDYEYADRAGEGQLTYIEESLALGRPAPGADGPAPAANRDGTPTPDRKPEQQPRKYSAQHTGWQGLDLDGICKLIFGALPTLPMELAARWAAIAQAIGTAHDKLDETTSMFWEGAAGDLFRSTIQRSLRTATAWIEAMPDRAASLNDAGSAVAGAQAELTAIIAEMNATIKKYEELIARTKDPVKIAEYRRQIEKAKQEALEKARQVGAKVGAELVAAGPWQVPPQFQGFYGLAQPTPLNGTVDSVNPAAPDSPYVMTISRDPLLPEQGEVQLPIVPFASIPFGDPGNIGGGSPIGGPNAAGVLGAGPTTTPATPLPGRNTQATSLGLGSGAPATTTGPADTPPGAYGGATGGAAGSGGATGGLLAGRGAGRAAPPNPPRPTVLDSGAPKGLDGQLFGRWEAASGRPTEAPPLPAVPPSGAAPGPLTGRPGGAAVPPPAVDPAPAPSAMPGVLGAAAVDGDDAGRGRTVGATRSNTARRTAAQG